MAQYATTDIHGCLKTFRYLVENSIGLRKKDTLYLLGDYVNKGPDSKGVLDYIMQLQAAGYRVQCLRGNHDQVLLDAIDIGKGANWLTLADKRKTLKSFGVSGFEQVPEKYIRFIRSLPLYIQTDNYLLVHAGLDFTLPAGVNLNDPYTLLNIKKFVPDVAKIGGRKLLHGHLPVPHKQILKSVDDNALSYNLDSGCVYYKNPEFGVLTALCLETSKLFFQPNIDQPYLIHKK